MRERLLTTCLCVYARVGCVGRGDYDLQQHAQHSRKDLRYIDPDNASYAVCFSSRGGSPCAVALIVCVWVSSNKFYPYVVEPAVGLDRLMTAFLTDAYTEEEIPVPSTGVRLPWGGWGTSGKGGCLLRGG